MITDGVGTSIIAGATTNVFLGRPIEFLGVPAVMRLLVVADAALQVMQLLINVGPNQIAPVAAGQPVNVAPAAGQGPKDDEDVVISNLAIPAGARLQLNITNTSGGTVITRFRAQII